MKKTLKLSAVILVATATASSAAITIHGSTTAYQESGGDWLTMGTNDIDGSGGLGTDGYFFFGDGGADTTQETNQAFTANVTNSPSYVSGFAAGADFSSVADDVAGYGLYDDPIGPSGTDTLGGIAVATGGGAGSDRQIMTFTLSGLTSGQIVRVGVLSNVDNNTNGRWDPTSLTLTEGANSATVGDHNGTQLANAAGGTDWVFFDVDSDGTYAVSGTKRLSGQGSSIAGLTFDSVPEPSSTALLGFGGIALLLRRRK